MQVSRSTEIVRASRGLLAVDFLCFWLQCEVSWQILKAKIWNSQKDLCNLLHLQEPSTKTFSSES